MTSPILFQSIHFLNSKSCFCLNHWLRPCSSCPVGEHNSQIKWTIVWRPSCFLLKWLDLIYILFRHVFSTSLLDLFVYLKHPCVHVSFVENYQNCPVTWGCYRLWFESYTSWSDFTVCVFTQVTWVADIYITKDSNERNYVMVPFAFTMFLVFLSESVYRHEAWNSGCDQHLFVSHSLSCHNLSACSLYVTQFTRLYGHWFHKQKFASLISQL